MEVCWNVEHSFSLSEGAVSPELERGNRIYGMSLDPNWFEGNSTGQCGVSSVWLAEVLATGRNKFLAVA
jgi:hypothetical protein